MSSTKDKKQTAYKDTPIGKIPTDWEVKKLGELGEVVTGLTYSPSQVRDTGLLVLRSSNVQDRVLVYNDNVYVDERDLKYNPVKKGDILICVRNGSRALIGKNARVDYKAEGLAFGAFMAIFRSVLNDYLFHFFDTDLYYKQIHVNLGATINSINNNDLRDFKISLPPLPEQKRIAEVLSTWDQAIQLTEQLIRQKEQRKKWLMQNLLTGKMRLKGFSGEWKFVKFKDFYSESKLKVGSKKYEVLSVTKTGIVPQSEYFNKEIASSNTSNYLIVEKGDFVVSGLNFWMGSFDVLSNFDIGIVSPAYKVYKLKVGFEKTFFKFLSKSKLMLDAMIGASIVGASIVRRNFDKEILMEWSFKIPSIEEQTAIAEVLQTADKEIELLKAKAEQLKEQKKGLMQQLLTGKKRLL